MSSKCHQRLRAVEAAAGQGVGAEQVARKPGRDLGKSEHGRGPQCAWQGREQQDGQPVRRVAGAGAEWEETGQGLAGHRREAGLPLSALGSHRGL